MAMKTNPIDIVIGPIETYDDQLFCYKAAYESYVLIKDRAWSERLARFAKYLPALQRELPVPAKHKAETPGSDDDLNAYFAIYYAGNRSEEHTSELQSLMRNSYAAFCLYHNNNNTTAADEDNSTTHIS